MKKKIKNKNSLNNDEKENKELNNEHNGIEKINYQLSEKEINELDRLYNREYPENVKNSMYKYSEDSNVINECLRNHKGMWNSELEKKYSLNTEQFENIVKNLDNNHVPLVKNTILHRGLNESFGEIKIWQKIIDRGYTSTSFDKGVAEWYAGKNGIIAYIDAIKGTKGIYIRQYSERPEEIEFLLPKGTELEFYAKKGNEIHCKLKYI